MRARNVLIWAAALLLPGAAAEASTSVPDWVAEAAAAPLPEHSRDARAIVLLADTLITVQPDGRAVERYRTAVKILRQRGRSDAEPPRSFRRMQSCAHFMCGALAPTATSTA